MKLLVAGSKDIDPRIALWELMKKVEPYGDFSLYLSFNHNGYYNNITEFVVRDQGKGADQAPDLLSDWWETGGYGVNCDIVKFPGSGTSRNKAMAQYADVLLLIWDGESSCSAELKKEMELLNKLVIDIRKEDLNAVY